MSGWKHQVSMLDRKVNPLLTLAGGLLGTIVSTVCFYYFATSGEFNARMIVFSLFPLGGILWFSTFDKGEQAHQKNPDGYWNFEEQPQKSKFASLSPALDYFGIILSVILAYFSIYLGEVLALTNATVSAYPGTDFGALFLEIFSLILTDETASMYIVRYWLGLTIVLVIMFVTLTVTSLYSKLKDGPGRKLTEEEQAKFVYGAFLFTRNNLSMEYLKGRTPQGKMQKSDAKQCLANDWDIADRAGVYETVSALLDEDNLEDWDAILPYVQAGEAKEEDQAIYENTFENLAKYGYTREEFDSIPSLGSWNFERVMHLVRQAFVAGYISEQEMWTFIDETIALAKEDYQTWHHYFAAYLLARNLYLQWDKDLSMHRVVAMKLLNNPHSVYQKFPMK